MENTDFTLKQVSNHWENDFSSAILLGSANLPFPVLSKLNKLPLDYNAAEGYRKNRIFPGCSELNYIEEYGENLLNSLFSTIEHFHVSFEPLSGTQANYTVYNAILNPGDVVLTLSQASGGHASHKYFLKKNYTLEEYHYSEEKKDIDYEEIENLCKELHPKLVIAGASSFPLAIKYDILGEICQKYGSFLLADISHMVLYIMSGLHTNPFQYADFITFTTHKTTRGPRGAILAYKEIHQENIKNSLFPFTQGAPIYSQICAKVLMLEELKKTNLLTYSNQILSLSNRFIEYCLSKNIPLWIPRTDSHMCIIDTTSLGVDADKLQTILENNKIQVTSCTLPKDTAIPHGIRFGFMMLATLEMQMKDFELLLDYISEIIFTQKVYCADKVTNLMKPYYEKFFKSGGERYE